MPYIQTGAGRTVPNTFNPVAGMHTSCVVFGLAGNSTLDTLYLDSIPATSSNTSQSGSGLSGVLNLGTNPNTNTAITFQYVVGRPGQLTAAQVARASQAMLQATAAKGAPIMPQPQLVQQTSVIAVGDSITNGGGALTTVWWPADLSLNAAYTSVVNEGIPGNAAWAFGNYEPWKNGPYCGTGGAPSAAVIFAGTNDIFVMGFTAAQTFQNILSWVNNMKGTSCQLFVGTMISRTGGGDADKDALNPLIRAGATQGLYNLIDFASIPRGADGAYSNTTYFDTDQTHPTNAGQVLLGAEASNVINAYGNGATSAAAHPVHEHCRYGKC